MGEASRRKAEIRAIKEAQASWFAGLTPQEQQVASIAELAHRRIVDEAGLVGGCYLLAFFLHRYLKKEIGIDTEAVVGWVNDGTTDLMASHAWIEFNGKKVDISLTKTEVPDVQLPGGLVILDRTVKKGRGDYTYHREMSPDALMALQELRVQQPDIVAAKAFEHQRVVATAKSTALIDAYLNNAPANRNYQALAAKMTSRGS